MICKACNHEMADDARFCTVCGAALEEPETVCEVEEAVEKVLEIPEEVAETVEEIVEAAVVPAEEPEEIVEVAVVPAEEPEEMVETAQAPEEPEEAPLVEAPTEMQNQRPAIKLPTGRGLSAMIFLSFLTFGIYPLIVWCKISGEINIVASRYDGKRSMHYLTVLLLSLPTCFILPLVWSHSLCGRIGRELKRRQVNYRFGAATMWLWEILYAVCVIALSVVAFIVLLTLSNVAKWVFVLAAAICLAVFCVGPFIFIYKMMKAMNLLNAHFNRYG